MTVFAIAAWLLIDHFNFLDKTAKGPKAKKGATTATPPSADKRAAAKSAGWFLGTTDPWATKYFDPNDLHCRDRAVFA